MKNNFTIIALVFSLGVSAIAQSVINPIDGLWANKQVLVLDVPPDSSAFYTLGDNDPETSGIIYDGAMLLDVTGQVTLKVVIVNNKTGEKFQKKVVYTVKEISPEPKAATATQVNEPNNAGDLNNSNNTSDLNNPINNKVISTNTQSRDIENAFIKKVLATPIIEYTPGTSINIPQTLGYALGSDALVIEQGKTLALSNKTIMSRYIALTLKKLNDEDYTAGMFSPLKNEPTPVNEDYLWRLVIHVTPVASGTFSKRNAPFRVNDWDTIEFVDKKYIYRIDSGLWKQPSKSIKIDRTKPHTISWQALEYDLDNPIKSLTLPPRPKIITKSNKVGSTAVSRKGDALYRFGYRENNELTSMLYDSFVIDTFPGDYFRGICKISVYYDGFYQGDEIIPYCVNKRIPARPVIKTKVKGLHEMPTVAFSRKLVTLVITKPKGTTLFADIMGPVMATGENYFDSVLFNFHDEKFLPLGNKVDEVTHVLTLHPSNKGAIAYKLRMYVEDKNGNKSSISQYNVVIDACNFYIDTASKNIDGADGTKSAPFSTIDQVLPYISQNRFTNIYLLGDLTMSARNINIPNNVAIIGRNNPKITLLATSSFYVKNATFSINGCSVDYDAKTINTGRFSNEDLDDGRVMKTIFQLDHGVLDLENVTLNATFDNNGVIFNSDGSSVSIKNSIITSNAQVYIAILTSVNSRINVSSSQFTTNASTSITFSCQGGLFTLSGSQSLVTGGMGRVAELFNTQSTITNNIFTAQLTNSRKNTSSYKAIYTDDKNVMIKYDKNDELGF